MSSLPPHDIAAEQAVLGAMMLSPDALAECLDLLAPTPAAFFRPAHQMVFAAIGTLADDGLPVDVLTVKAELERRRELGKVSGADYLHTLIASVPTAANGAWYARQLLEIRMSRALAEVSGTIAAIAADPGLDGTEKAEAAHAALDAATGTANHAGAVSVASLIDPWLDMLASSPGTTQGILSGWRDLNEVIPGFRPGEVVIVAGRPGAGKSVVLLNIATHAGVFGQIPVLACSLEMSHDEYMERIVASVAGVNLERIRDHTLTDGDWERVAKVRGQIAEAHNFRVVADTGLTLQGIRAELRAMRRSGHPARLVTVDYLQLMTDQAKPENRQMEVSALSRSLKKLAGEFGVPVLVGSQFNRGPEMRADHRPVLADLRESGSLEQDCSIAILLYRDDMYVVDSPHAGEIDLIVAKNRQGRLATVTLAWRGHYAMCGDLYREVA